MAPDLVVLALALVLELLVGEPANALHPVAWIGTTASAVLRLAPGQGPRRQFAFGVLVTLLVACGFAAASLFILDAVAGSPIAKVVVAGVMLKSMFAIRALGRAALDVRRGLAAGDLSRARHDLRCLCSRDASRLDEAHLVSAAIESLAENASDSFVAPLFYYVLFGVPGAVFYRAVNTLDAMIGYHGRYEYLGKFAARLDDVLNLIPARLTAMMVVVGASLCGGDGLRGWRTIVRDAGTTESPNAGYPMAAIAGALGVTLEKPGHYRLGDSIAPAGLATIDAAWHIVLASSTLAVGSAAIAIGARHG